MEVRQISGDPEFIAGKLQEMLIEGWEILDLTTSIYQSSGGLRTVTTVYLKKEAA